MQQVRGPSPRRWTRRPEPSRGRLSRARVRVTDAFNAYRVASSLSTSSSSRPLLRASSPFFLFPGLTSVFLLSTQSSFHGILGTPLNHAATWGPIWQRTVQPPCTFNCEETRAGTWTNVTGGTSNTCPVSHATAFKSEAIAYALSKCEPFTPKRE